MRWNFSKRLRLLGVLVMLWSQAACAFDPLIPRRAATWTGTVCSIPPAAYQWPPRSVSVFAPSVPVQSMQGAAERSLMIQAAVDGKWPLAATPGPSIKRLQPVTNELRIDQCRISSVMLEIYSSGYWTLSLRADHNPAPTPEEADQFGEDLHLKRNRYHVRVRLLTEPNTPLPGQLAGENATITPAAPNHSLMELSTPGFWVRKRQPNHQHFQGSSELLSMNFVRIEGAEFELYYEMDAYHGALIDERHRTQFP